MTDTPTLTLGPYRQGEIPPPIVNTFEDSTGAPIDLSGFTSKLEYKRWNSSMVVERTPAIAVDQVTNKGRAIWTLVAADLATAGDFWGEWWVGNGTNRYASVKLRWFVEPTIAVPTV
jgi:hypothetical protein